MTTAGRDRHAKFDPITSGWRRICDDGSVSDVTTATEPPREFDCPRCGQSVAETFYGPCDRCSQDLRMNMGNEPRHLEKVVYETKMNVVPNHVATKE